MEGRVGGCGDSIHNTEHDEQDKERELKNITEILELEAEIKTDDENASHTCKPKHI